MRKSVFVKILFSYILIIVFLLIPVSFFSFKSIQSHYISTVAKNLETQARALIPYATELIAQPEKADAAVTELARDTEMRVTLIGKDGTVLADSEKKLSELENHADRIEIRKAFSGKVGISKRFSESVKRDMLYVTVPVSENGEVYSVIRVSMYLEDITGLIRDIAMSLLRITAVVLMLTLLLSYMLSRYITAPIKALSEASGEIASGNFKVKLHLKNRDELGMLAESFNAMTKKLEGLFSATRQSEEKMRAIIESFEEYLFVLDGEHRLTMCNSGFKRFIDKEFHYGDHISDLLNSPELLRLITAHNAGEGLSEITMDKKFYLVGINIVKGSGEYVVILHDITRLKNADMFKKDLVANVSHELRTPLTAIKGFVETLETEKAPLNMKYIAIIKKHTDRLINIVSDLITLSKLEDGKVREKFEDVDLANCVNDIALIYRDKAAAKGLTFNIDMPENPFVIRGQEFRIEQLLVNLLDNAFKYTEKGSVTVSLKDTERGNEMTVSDTGIGIRTADQDRIFERFFVADRSRSKNTGGTGLGLSIVKHIVNLHNASMEVSSSVGKGSVFTVIFPKDVKK